MGDPAGRNGDGEKPAPDDDSDLSARLRGLDARLEETASRRASERRAGSRAASDMSGLGKAFRFSAEFIAGVLAGTLVGWAIDQWLGWTPWAMIVGLILGFCAGMLNIMRAAGELNRKPGSGMAPRERESSDDGDGRP